MNLGKKLTFFSIIVISLTGAWTASAALNLSANPADGGNTLRMGRVDGALEINKAVKLRISASDGKQYQVYQRLEDSLVNERQNILDSQAVNSYAVGGSNASGTLYAQQYEPLHFNDQLIYTSAPDGQSDSLTIVYNVDPQRINASGNYVGRIAYTVRSLGGSQDEVFLNVYLEASGQFRAEVTGATSHDGISLKYNHRSDKEDSIRVRFSGNVGDEVKIYQEVRNFPRDDSGQDLEASALEFSTSGAHGELYHAAPEPVGRKKVLIYKSRETEDEFEIKFGLNAERLATLKSGTYRGTIVLTVDAPTGPQEFPMDVGITVEPIFEVNVSLPPGGIKFAHLLPTDPPQVQEVDVEVKTNLGRPYMVIHSMATPLTTPRGDQIKSDNFTMKMELVGNTSGKAEAGDFMPVRTGDMPVFFSDAKGSPAQFKVFYRLRSNPDVAAGDYTAPIVFSLGEM
jgi:hypothetical protein